MERFHYIIELNRLQLLAKTVDELEKQDKEIKKRIARKGLIKEKKQNTVDVKAAK